MLIKLYLKKKTPEVWENFGEKKKKKKKFFRLLKSKFQCKSKFHGLLNFIDFAGDFLTKSPAFYYN